MSIKQKIPEVKFFDTNKTFKFENGETIDNLKIAYTINGRLNVKKITLFLFVMLLRETRMSLYGGVIL